MISSRLLPKKLRWWSYYLKWSPPGEEQLDGRDDKLIFLNIL